MKSSSVFKYHSKIELLPFVGKEVEFEGFGTKSNNGILEIEYTKQGYNLWLPFCGLVNALTVKIKL